MNLRVQRVESSAIADLRERHWAEVNGQVVHALIHRRPGWTEDWLLEADGVRCGFACVAVAGPWTGRRTVLEFQVASAWLGHAFGLFEAFVGAANVCSFEFQTNFGVEGLLPHVYGTEVVSEKIVFRDGPVNGAHYPGASLCPLTELDALRAAISERRGGGEWRLEWNGQVVGRGGLLFHYNPPFGDLWMEVDPAARRQGLGTWLVRQLRRECRELGQVPAARCDPANVASRRTLLRAGFLPVGHILIGKLARR